MASMKAELLLSEDFDKQLQDRIHQEVIQAVSELAPQHDEPKKLNIGQAAVYAGVARNTYGRRIKPERKHYEFV